MTTPDAVIVSFVGTVLMTLSGVVGTLWRKMSRENRERLLSLERRADECEKDREALRTVAEHTQYTLGNLSSKVQNLENCPCGECPYRPPARARKDVPYDNPNQTSSPETV